MTISAATNWSTAAPQFLALLEVISGLPTLPAELLEEHYSGVAFGSWGLTLRYRGRPFRLSFDGKEYCYRLECGSRHSPTTFEPIWEQLTGVRLLPSDLLDVIRTAG